MKPLPLVVVGVGLCVSSANPEYKLKVIDGPSSTSPQYRSINDSESQTEGPVTTAVVVHKKSVTIEEKIDATCSDPDNFEEGEDHPSAEAIGELKRILSEASEINHSDIPDGDVSPYFGEVSVTWRRDNRMLRLTVFSDGRDARLDFGTTPESSLGNYQFNPTANGESLVNQLNWLLATKQVAVARASVSA